MPKALQIHPRDNVAVVLSDVKAGEEVIVGTESEVITLKALNDISFGHKIALRELAEHEPIFKYGEEIGRASQVIARGDWVHLHNVYCERGRED